MVSFKKDAQKVNKMHSDDIVVVSQSCFLPGSKNVSEFQNNILAGKSFVDELSDARWNKKINYSPYKEVDDKSYSHFGAEISEQTYNELAEKWQIFSKNKLELMAIESMSQAIDGIQLPSDRRKIGVLLGAMNPDENYYITRFKKQLVPLLLEIENSYNKDEFEKIRPYLDQHCRYLFKDIQESIDDLLPQSVIEKICQRFNLNGPRFFVDAACAAALASFETAISLIDSNIIEFAFVGGIESNLGQGSYVLFSKVGALSPTQTLPFDKKSKGLSQGEGAVIFGIQKRSMAKKMGNPILATIVRIGSSSDGQVASLFQPDYEGQKLALERAYLGLNSRNIDFLEMHGTGTQIGDSTEAKSANEFFQNFKIPVGSLKYQIGHTKATAGAASLLKCLTIAKYRTIPANSYCSEPIMDEQSSLFINKQQLTIPDNDFYRFGISSFGFGGTNFHMVIDVENINSNKNKIIESQNALPRQIKNLKLKNKAVIIGKKTIEWNKFTAQNFTGRQSFYKIPPYSIPFIDCAQLLAVQVVKELLFDDLNIHLNQKIKDEIQIISASTTGLDILDDIVARVSLDTIAETISQEQVYPELAKKIFQLKSKFQNVSEESGPGILNNVIAGRVSNAFHFRGRNMNIDCEESSISAALLVAQSTIENNSDAIVIVIGIHEKIDEFELKVHRSGVTAYLVASKNFAQQQMLPIESELRSADATI